MQHNEYQKYMDDEEELVTNFENPSLYDEKMLINAPGNDLKIPLPKRTFKASLAAEYSELLQRLKI